MQNEKRKDRLENNETLDFLISITEMLKASNAVLGRNERMFAIDTSQVPEILMDENADFGSLFIERKLVVDHENKFGEMSVVTEIYTDNGILFCDIADSLSPLNHNEDFGYPLQEEVRNWFLTIPQFSEEDKVKYENIYQNNKTKIGGLMHEHAYELYKTIYSVGIND